MDLKIFYHGDIFMRLYPLIAVLLITLFLVPMFNTAPVEAQRPTRTIIFKGVPQEQGLPQVEAGLLDAYFFGVPPDVAQLNLNNPNIRMMVAARGINSIILNPVEPYDNTTLNPFVNKKIRFAVNYLIDRRFVAEEIYKGLAYEMFTIVSPADPDYATVADIIAKYETPYAPELAKQIIAEEMTKMGAEMVDGKWYYNGEPVTLNFIIRTEDERHSIGLLLADELEGVGFTVNRIETTFGPAIFTVYFTDPGEMQWHLYTEGWGKGALVKWDDGGPAFWGAPWAGNMPGWGDPTYASYQNETLDNITMQLAFAEFATDKALRDELYRKATEMIIQEAVRLFVVTTLDAYPMDKNMRGLTEDLAAGIASWFNLREMYVPGDDTLEVGHLHVYTSRTFWGPIDAFGFHFWDVYSVDPWTAVHDVMLWRHPYKGTVIPATVQFEVETTGSEAGITIPSDAFMWDYENDMWANVGPGLKVQSKVTFDLTDYFKLKWHHGRNVSWADILYDIYLYWEWTFDPDKISIDPLWNIFFSDSLSLTKAFRIVDDTTLEVYINYSHFDPGEIAAAAAPPSTSFPWEAIYPTEQMVLEGAVSWNRWGENHINYVLSDYANMIRDKALDLMNAQQYPENVFTVDGDLLFDLNSALQGYQAVADWVNAHGHAVISNGPFYLDSFDPAGDQLVLKEFEDYPFPPGKWVIGEAPTLEFVNIFAPSVIAGEEARIIVDVEGPTPLTVTFTLRDPVTREILLQGEATPITATRFEVVLTPEFTAQIGPGTYEIEFLLASDEVATFDFARVFFSVSGGGVLGDAIDSLNDRVSAIEGALDDLRGQLADVSTELAQAIGLLRDSITELGDSLTQTLNQINTGLTSLADELDSVKSTSDQTASDVSTLVDSVDELTAAVNQLSQTLMGLLAVVVVLNIVVIVLVLRKK